MSMAQVRKALTDLPDLSSVLEQVVGWHVIVVLASWGSFQPTPHVRPIRASDRASVTMLAAGNSAARKARSLGMSLVTSKAPPSSPARAATEPRGVQRLDPGSNCVRIEARLRSSGVAQFQRDHAAQWLDVGDHRGDAVYGRHPGRRRIRDRAWARHMNVGDPIMLTVDKARRLASSAEVPERDFRDLVTPSGSSWPYVGGFGQTRETSPA
jgi:hypothetical protein